MFSTEFALALVGVIGTGVGVVASLIPTELLAKRDHHERVAKLCNILVLEALRIQSICQTYISLTKEVINASKQNPSYVFSPNTFSRLPFVAGQAALSNGDFIAQIPKETAAQLSKAYAGLDILNALIDGYSLFTQTSRSLLNFGSSVVGYYESLNTLCSTIHAEFQPLQEEITKQLRENADLAARRHRWIQLAKWAAVTIFLIAGILMVVFFILQANSSPQPLPTPTSTP